MINSLVGWFSAKRSGYRSESTKAARFAIDFITDDGKRNSATGTTLGVTGLSFLTKTPPPSSQQFNALFSVRGRNIRSRLEVERQNIARQGAEMFQYVECKFVGIAADDWDLIARFVNDLPEPTDVLSKELDKLRDKADDAYRLLPLALQDKLVAALAEVRRLEQPVAGQAPALRMEYLGRSKRDDGAIVHRINVHSRKRINEQWHSFDSQVLVDERGDLQILN
jgi:hypothetical protein